MKAILIATKETIDVIKAGEYTNIYVTEDGKQSFLGDELILLDEVKREAKGRDWEEVRINAAIATIFIALTVAIINIGNYIALCTKNYINK